ncbi:MAG: FkbM family methyltransferase [Selenomonadaceae bacterium]|nr:FkbM family methyltransferase [Selenomonadaceae bacterium]
MAAGIYLFPFKDITKDSRIVIYGAGAVAQDYIKQIKETEYCSIVCVVDSNYNGKTLVSQMGVEVLSPMVLEEKSDFDVIVIATVIDNFMKQIKDRLHSMGYRDDNIVAVLPKNIPVTSSTYSQHGEDMIIYFAFKHMGFFKNGKLPTYIDVGAHHPYNISNTALFHTLGCHGVNIEANPVLIEKFNEERPNDINLCVGIGPKEGTFPFYISDVLGLNTFKRENLTYNEFLVKVDTGEKVRYDVKEVINLPVKRLDDIVAEYCGGVWPDFMSIDIEGMEYDSLQNCDLNNGPALIAVEVNYDGDLFIELMKEKGYFTYLWYRENILFIRNDYETLVHAHTERNEG